MKGILSSFSASLAILIVTTIGGVLSARILLPTGKGELTAIMLWPSLLATIGSLGIADAVTFLVASTAQHPARILASALFVTTVLSVVLAALGFLIIPIVLAPYGTGVVTAANLYLAYIPVNLAALSMMSILLGKMRLYEYSLLRVLVQAGSVVGMVVLFAAGQASASSFAGTSWIANAVTAAIAFGMIVRTGWWSWRPDAHLIGRLLGYGLRVHLGSVASILNLRLDQMLMSALLQPSILGLYVVAVTVSGGVSLAASAVGQVAFPRIAGLESPAAKEFALGRFMRLGLSMSLLSAVVLWWLAPGLLGLFFGEAYVPATEAARILILAAIPLSCNLLLAANFKAFERPIVASKAEMLSVVVTGVALWTLLPGCGALGAAWASLLAYSVTCAFLLYSTKNELGIALVSLFRPKAADLVYIVNQAEVVRSWAVPCRWPGRLR